MHLGQTGDLGRHRKEDDIAQALIAPGQRAENLAENLAEVAHDARNMVTALGLYCDLLEEPGVLAVPFAHYGNELRLIAAASRRLVEKLVALDAQGRWEAAHDLSGQAETGGLATADGDRMSSDWAPGLSANQNTEAVLRRSFEHSRGWEAAFAQPVRNLAAELVANHSLLSALAGPGIAVTVDAESGARPVRLSAEDLTRLLVNLVKNAAEAMPSGGSVQITLQERPADNNAGARVAIVVEDTGPGIPPSILERIFDSGFTTHPKSLPSAGGWPMIHRGLGLAISRAIVESSGGHITVSNRPEGGACFEIELPVRTP